MEEEAYMLLIMMVIESTVMVLFLGRRKM